MRSIILILLSICYINSIIAQAPKQFKYQAVARDVNNQPYSNTKLRIKFSIIANSPSGSAQYVEEHTITTSSLGVFDAVIGGGTKLQGSMDGIEWGTNTYYIKIELNPQLSGGSFINMGTSQLLSVPYAMYANQAGGGSSGGNDSQTLEINGSQLSISNGNTVNLPPSFSLPHNGTYTSGDAVLTVFNTLGAGVAGVSDGGNIGVHGESRLGIGVAGFSSSGAGVNGSSQTGPGVIAISFEGVGLEAFGTNVGIDAEGLTGINAESTNPAGYSGWFKQRLHADIMEKGSGSFKIDHPLDPANKYLYHSFVESPDMMNVYNGNILTDTEGRAIVTLPTYFESLNMDFRYQLTCVGTFAQVYIEKEIENNTLVIKADKPNVKISWQVTGIRKDAHAEKYRIVPETNKEEEYKGKYLCPTCFNQPEAQGIRYNDRQKEAVELDRIMNKKQVQQPKK